MKSMKYLRLFFALITTTLFIGCGGDDVPETQLAAVRYNDLYFSNVDISNDIVYGTNTTLGGTTHQLVMDVYEPKADTETKRPLIIIAHGGGFTGGNKSDMSAVATFFARSGYVVASINYRLLDIAVTPENIKKATMQATFDMKAAIRFFRKDEVSTNTYKVDINNIFIGGYSAGAFMALHAGYLKSGVEISQLDTSTRDYINTNGGIEGNSGNQGFSSNAKGVLNISGALLKASFVSPNEPILYSVHGTNDTVVPYGSGESNNTGVTTEGSQLIHQAAETAGITNELRTIQGAGHEAFFLCGDCSASLRTFVYKNLN